MNGTSPGRRRSVIWSTSPDCTIARCEWASIAAASTRPSGNSSIPPIQSPRCSRARWNTSPLLDSLHFTRYCVSLKDSSPAKVIEVNRRFAEARPDVPLHLGVTEAGLPPDGIVKTRIALEQLLACGIGDTIRVSLTVPNDEKHQEIIAGKQILADVQAGRMLNVIESGAAELNIIACPSCSRVENEAFIELAQQVKAMTTYAQTTPSPSP